MLLSTVANRPASLKTCMGRHACHFWNSFGAPYTASFIWLRLTCCIHGRAHPLYVAVVTASLQPAPQPLANPCPALLLEPRLVACCLVRGQALSCRRLLQCCCMCMARERHGTPMMRAWALHWQRKAQWTASFSAQTLSAEQFYSAVGEGSLHSCQRGSV